MGNKLNISIFGLGYVGLPLAIKLSNHFNVLGFDKNKQRIKELKKFLDRNREVSFIELKKSKLRYSTNLKDLKNSNIFIVTVPTPVTKSNQPDLKPLLQACKDIGKIVSENIDNLTYQSIYDLKKIKSLYSNLDTVSFWDLEKEIKLLKDRGYSTREMRTKLQRSFAFPLFLLSMLLLSAVFTLGTRFKENNWSYVFIAIISSVIIHYFNDFSAALGKTNKLPIELSVWMPLVIIFIFSSVGLIHANQK